MTKTEFVEQVRQIFVDYFRYKITTLQQTEKLEEVYNKIREELSKELKEETKSK